ncbi:hypothetical protein FNI42_14675 [Salmonella enterica subsp. salamae]|nr:hypothetical protein [Salmonella enterica subsp. salamae]
MTYKHEAPLPAIPFLLLAQAPDVGASGKHKEQLKNWLKKTSLSVPVLRTAKMIFKYKIKELAFRAIVQKLTIAREQK